MNDTQAEVEARRDRAAPSVLKKAPESKKAPASIRKRALWAVILMMALAALVWAIRPQGTPQGRSAVGGPVPVASATAQKGDIGVTLNALGTVTPLATVTVRTQINGQLVQVAFQEGQTVRKGDFLAEIDPRPYQLQLEQAQGQLLHDQALLKNAELDVARYRTLVAQDSIAKQTLDTQEALVRQLQGTVRVDQAQVDNANLNLTYCHIISPVTGRVGLRLVDQGNYVQTSDANGLVVITQIQPITVIFTLPEDNLPAVLKRLNAGATLEVTAYDRSQTTKLATGQLMTIDNQIDTTTGMVKLRAQFDNDDGMLFPNQFVNVRLLLDMLHDATIAPVSAIQRGAPGTYVYLVRPDGTVAVRPVKLGPTAGERVAIESGLAPGDVVVVDGADKLRDGAKVTLPGTSGPAEATGDTGQRNRQP